MTSQSKKVFFLFCSGFLGMLLTTITINLAFYKPLNGSAGDDSSEGHALMKKFGCLSCHKLHGAGSNVGPALDRVGAKRDPEWIARWIRNSSSIKRNSRMPPFFYLPDEQIRIIAEYLGQQRAETSHQTTRP